jgi:hypothetical protein
VEEKVEEEYEEEKNKGMKERIMIMKGHKKQ